MIAGQVDAPELCGLLCTRVYIHMYACRYAHVQRLHLCAYLYVHVFVFGQGDDGGVYVISCREGRR